MRAIHAFLNEDSVHRSGFVNKFGDKKQRCVPLSDLCNARKNYVQIIFLNKYIVQNENFMD